jgi:pteridine reductase
MARKTVLITGAAHRIGAAIARALHAEDMDIVIHHNRSSDKAEELSNELNTARSDSALVIHGDLLNADNYAKLIEQTLAFKKNLDVLINNASTFYPTPLGQISIADWQNLIGVNMQAPLFLSQQAAPYLAQRHGCIINMTDIHAQRPLKDHAVYSAAKAGLVMLTQALAKELGPAIRVNAISPGAILWPEDLQDEQRADILEQIVLGKTGCVDDITKAVRYLINDADYVTGQILTIDGGRTLYS